MNEKTHTPEPTEDKYGGAPPPEAKTPDERPVPARGGRASFGAIRRQLTDEELQSAAVQKLLLDMLDEAEAERDEYKAYVEAFHTADKKASVLSERLNADRSIEVFFGAGMSIGGVLCGLTPFFWALDTLYGIMCGIVGLALVGAACVGRMIKK